MKPRLRCALLPLLVVLVTRPAAPLHAQTGAGGIAGTVENRTAQRRTADRYLTTGPVRAVQSLSAVVFLEGAASGAALRPAAPVRMAQRDTAFAPAVLVVPVGTVIEFPNEDGFFHNVFSYSDAKRFDLGRYPRGESKSVLMDRPGVVRVYCEVHEFMRAAVVVVESRHAAIVDGDGRFALHDVPAGRHTLVAWHPERGQKEIPVTVATESVARVTVTY